MFNRNDKQRILELERSLAIAQDMIARQAVLIDIHREGRVLTFTFIRNGEPYRIETMGMMSDNLPEWKARLL